MTMSETCKRREVYFRVVLGADWKQTPWTTSSYQDYAATVRLYNKYANGRTYEQFLEQMIGGKR